MDISRIKVSGFDQCALEQAQLLYDSCSGILPCLLPRRVIKSILLWCVEAWLECFSHRTPSAALPIQTRRSRPGCCMDVYSTPLWLLQHGKFSASHLAGKLQAVCPAFGWVAKDTQCHIAAQAVAPTTDLCLRYAREVVLVTVSVICHGLLWNCL